MGSTKVQQLQLTQQNLQTILIQKQQIESQLAEFSSALMELSTTDSAYKVLGKIMVAMPAERLKKELQEKKEVVEIRFQNFIQQEKKIQKTLEMLQKEALEEMKGQNL
ncbi:MAG TPA: prefoldin subunit [Candidatus Nanoarchaeia archaeon]|nr:prefoldin subunit [Candidatus Nanoarchaeia archaeon]